MLNHAKYLLEFASGELSPLWLQEQRIPGGLVVRDANGQSLAYVYWRETKDAANIAGVLTEDEARRIAGNIAKLRHGSGHCQKSMRLRRK
jgi:hypothetical protein